MLGENLENVRLIYLIFEYLQDYRVYFVPYNVPQKCQRLQERMAIYTQDSSWFVWEKKKKKERNNKSRNNKNRIKCCERKHCQWDLS